MTPSRTGASRVGLLARLRLRATAYRKPEPSPLDVGRFTHLTRRAEQQRVTAELEQAFQQDDPQR